MSATIQLYLLRHGHAVMAEEDPARPLSTRGRDQIRALAMFVRDRGSITVERAWHSPLLRAVETTEIFCDTIGLQATRREIDGLLPDDDIRGVARRLSGFGHSLLVVGHEPHLGRLASLLVCGNVDQDLVDFQKGALLCLERTSSRSEAVSWYIRWFLPPSLLLPDNGGASD